MLKKYFFGFFFSIIILFSFVFPVNSVNEISTVGNNCIVYYPLSKDILYQKNIHNKVSMASTTKIMTCIVAIENCNLSRSVTVTDELIKIEGSSAGLQAGMILSLNDLLYCLMLPSGNEAANIIAVTVSGSADKFADLMNDTAKKIGMNESNFVTASGLDDDNHYTTAYDMALLTAYALDNPVFCRICSTIKYTVECENGEILSLSNHNKLLSENSCCIGVKTGFTKKSGRCLVSAYKKDGAIIIIVTLNDSDDWNDHRILYEYGYSRLKKFDFGDKLIFHNLKTLNNENINIGLQRSYIYIPDTYYDVDIDINVNKKFYQSVCRYQIVGDLVLSVNENKINIPIYAENDVNYFEKNKTGLKDRIIKFFYRITEVFYE